MLAISLRRLGTVSFTSPDTKPRNDVSPTVRRFHHCIRCRTHKPRSDPKETWWKYLRVNVWRTHEISILTFCDTFERTSWNTMWESPSIVGDCQTHWNSAWLMTRPSSFKSALEPQSFATPLRPSCSTITALSSTFLVWVSVRFARSTSFPSMDARWRMALQRHHAVLAACPPLLANL